MLDVLRLGNSSDEIRAALLLRHSHNIRLRVSPEQMDELTTLGFVESPESIACFVDLEQLNDRKSRHRRKNMRRAFHAWQERGIDFTLTDVGSFTVARLIEEVYFPIFVKCFFARGISPYGAHNLETFRGFVKADMFLALAYQGKELVGAAILHPSMSTRAHLPVSGKFPAGACAEGLIIAISSEHGEIRRAFVEVLSSTLHGLGYKWLCLGRDLTWMGPRYSQVFLEKLRSSDAVTMCISDYRYLFSWKTNITSDGSIFFMRAEGSLKSALLGSSNSTVEQIRDRLNSTSSNHHHAWRDDKFPRTRCLSGTLNSG